MGSNFDQVQVNHITPVEEQKGEDTINYPSLIKNCLHQNNGLAFSNNSQYDNLDETSYIINSFDQPPVLGSHHSHASICHDKCPSTSCDLDFPLVKEYFHIETSSSPHFPTCPTIQNTSTCIRDTPFSLTSSSDDLSPQLTQGSEVVHDEVENNLIIERTSHSQSSLLLHEDNSSSQLVEPKKCSETYDRDGFYPKRNYEISNNNHPQGMHDLVQA